MTDTEVRWPCPVCPGVRMEKRRVGRGGVVVLDRCGRCGGVWFERGEVQALRALRPAELLPHLAPRDVVHRTRCRHCDGIVDRDAAACPACDAPVRLDCPSCDRRLETREHQGLRLDVCRRCHGVWFDQHELRHLWRLGAAEVGRRRRASGAGGAKARRAAGDAADHGAVDALFFAPDAVYLGGDALWHAAAAGAGSAPELAGGAAELAGGAVEAAGEVAANAFVLIVEAICSLF